MKVAARRLAELRLALGFLTRLPVPLDERRPWSVAEAGWAFPVCGAVVGLFAWLGYAFGASLALPGLLCALFALAASALVTGGLHEDGLADFADGMGGGADRDRKLEIMRDSAIGSYGVLALVFVVAAKAVAIGELDGPATALGALIALSAASRFAMLLGMAVLPPARSDGLGRDAGWPGQWQLWAGLAVTLLALAPLGAKGGAAFAGVLIAAIIPATLAWRQIGGQTGDVLGAIQQISELGGWMIFVGYGQGS